MWCGRVGVSESNNMLPHDDGPVKEKLNVLEVIEGEEDSFWKLRPTLLGSFLPGLGRSTATKSTRE